MNLGLTEAEVALRAGVTLDEYRDIEQHEDEAFQVVPLRKLRPLCTILGLDPLALLGVRCPFCAGSNPAVARAGRRHDVVRERRVALGFSQAELAERIGFEAGVVDDIERDREYLEGWSMELVLSLAQVLGIPPQVFLNVRCGKCGR